ncbi:MAG TPA: hypothetical protein VN317_09795 [Candidatus Methanoperedens sp.]|nr:hypothetical protein [Candidatus Methanoperedens sp.]
MWDATKYEVTALVKRDGQPAGSVTLAPGKTASSFEGTLAVTAPGTYEVTVYAFDPANGNAGVDFVSFTAR